MQIRIEFLNANEKKVEIYCKRPFKFFCEINICVTIDIIQCIGFFSLLRTP